MASFLALWEPADFDERFFAYLCDPWGDDWEQAAMIAAEVHNAGCKTGGGEPRAYDCFWSRYDPDRPAAQDDGWERLEQQARRMYGG